MSFALRQHVTALLMEEQHGLCICGKTLREPRLDHDHDTDLVRGLLCNGCNSSEGRAPADDPLFGPYRANPPAARIGLVMDYWRISGPRPPSPERQAEIDAAKAARLAAAAAEESEAHALLAS